MLRSKSSALSSLILAAVLAAPMSAQQGALTFMDVQRINRGGSWAPSPDGALMLYTITTPDWQEDQSQSDIHVVSLSEGVASSRQLTFTGDKNESQPTWAPDGSYFVFASNRDSDDSENQLYVMRHDGGEARKITDEEHGVSGFSFSPDGSWLVYRSGDSGQEQLHRLPVSDLFVADAEQITAGQAGVEQWDWSPDGATIYFVRPDSFDEDDKRRREEGFTVDVKNAVTPLSSLWSVEVASMRERRLTQDSGFSVDGFVVSDDGRWLSFTGGSSERYDRNITGARLYADQYLMDVATGAVERLTENYEVGESATRFSPDGRWIAFSGPDDLERYSMTENRIYIREVESRGGAFRKLGSAFDQSLSIGFWSEDSRTIYFNAGVKVTSQLHALDIERDEVTQVTEERASLSVTRDDDTGVILINYSDPRTPPTVFTVSDVHDVDRRSRWIQLVDLNPQLAEVALGEEVEINWTSTDGKTVGGVLVYPVGYQEGTRYPLIVAIHGGPASADVLRFRGGYSSAQVYAGAGYATLKPTGDPGTTETHIGRTS